jgi:hypothetical protein
LYTSGEDAYLDELSGYGIIRDILPTDMGGAHDFDYTAWLHRRRDTGL